MTAVLNEHFSIVYDICRAACHGDTALGRSSVKKLAALIESSTPDDAALLKRLTKKAAKNPAHFVQSDEGGSKPAPSVEQDERGAFEAEWNRRAKVKRLAKNIAQLVGLWLLLGALLAAAALVIVPADPPMTTYGRVT